MQRTLGWWKSGLVLASLGLGCALLPSCATDEPIEDQEEDGIELATNEQAAAIVAEVRAGYRYVGEGHLDEEMAELAKGPVLQPSEAKRLVRDGDGWRADVPRAPVEEVPHPTSVHIGARASDGFVLTDVDAGVAVRATLVGATEAQAAFADGYAVYANALESADVVHRFSAGGVEDFVLLREAPARPELRYRFELEGSVAGLRLVGRTLEMLDAKGTPRLRVAPPYVVDAAGRWLDAELAVHGCAVDTDPRVPFDRPVTDPGARSCELVVSWPDETLSYPVLVDPAWSQPASHMITRRWFHGAEKLPDGRVLLFGGDTLTGSTGATELCEIFDPATTSYSATGSMTNKRYGFGWATVTDGSSTWVLAAGGFGNCTGSFCDKAERYRTSDGTWEAAGTMPSGARYDYPLVVVTDGTNRAFATGGQSNAAGNALATVDSYDPGGNSWDPKTSMSVGRKGHTAVALVNNSDQIIVMGGRATAGTHLSSAERYTPLPEPQNSSWVSAGSLPSGRYGHAMVRLDGDVVLVIGGQYTSDACTNAVHKATAPFNSWTGISSMWGNRCYHAAAILEDGNVLASGGRTQPTTGNSIATSQVYDVANALWVPFQSSYPMATARHRHTATLYPVAGGADKVLAAGGLNKNGATTTVLWEGEMFTP